ncbi:MAG: exosortase-associated EpsI family protein [Planctomycetia bacterium]|nr:exosortase-associated EpsI family protein [Planctomycetia bacterium]
MTRTAALLAALTAVLLSGALHGMWTERWHTSDARRLAGERLGKLPLRLGDWEGQDQPMDQREFDIAMIDGYVMRRYVRPQDGSAVSLLLVSGRHGPVSVHSPEVCYAGAGYVQVTRPGRDDVSAGDGAAQQFFRAKFAKENTVDADSLSIRWGWSTGGDWQAPTNPRLAFARADVLYKLYLVGPGSIGKDQPDPVAEFMNVLLPELKKSLSP